MVKVVDASQLPVPGVTVSLTDNGAPLRRLLFPVVGSLGIGYLLYRYFPNARGSGVPQTKAAL